MKNIFLILTVLLSTLSAYSYVYEAKPVRGLMKLINEAKFEHKEDGLVFGFFSIQSCLYVSSELVVLKNYCLPKKDYPAKGYTIISPEFGIIDLYQEDIGSENKRDILITAFPDELKDYVSAPLQGYSLADLNGILEKLYNKNSSGCWSTNLSYSNGKPVVQCSIAEVLHFDLWAKETQSLTGDFKVYSQLMESVEESILK